MTGPNPTDRGKPGTKYHVVVSTDGLPLAVIPSPANVHDTMLFPDLLRLAQVVCAAIGRLYAAAGYDSADNRWLCLRDGVQPHIRKRSASPTARGSARSEASSSTAALGCWRTNAWIDDTTGWRGSYSRCSPRRISSSSPTASARSENHPLNMEGPPGDARAGRRRRSLLPPSDPVPSFNQRR
ncbi:transposase [Azospirillum sp. CT11-132]|uniref:transposase n=1 Tax=Azospirillum sp. CT11-132 TaxID=3396317 RepID=UPI0039A40A84